MKKIIWTLIIIGMLGLVGATLTLTKFDTKETVLKSAPICEKEAPQISNVQKCDDDIPSEIVVDFDKEKKTGLIKIDYAGIKRSVDKQKLTP